MGSAITAITNGFRLISENAPADGLAALAPETSACPARSFQANRFPMRLEGLR
jgi:hypothetical protein